MNKCTNCGDETNFEITETEFNGDTTIVRYWCYTCDHEWEEYDIESPDEFSYAEELKD